MKILITGGTGFIGSKIVMARKALGDKMFVYTRKIEKAEKILGKSKSITYFTNFDDIKDKKIDIIINLAGETLKGKWTKEKKQEIIDSRIKTTSSLVEFIKNSDKKPSLLINGSAIGYYGFSSKIFSEESEVISNDFNHNLCKKWENEAILAEEYGTRVCCIRLGVVLGTDGGAFKEMISPFKFGFGAILGDGNQPISWIHMYDVIAAINHIIKNKKITGAVNLVANYTTNRKFSKSLASQLNRPLFLRLPEKIVRLIFGESADYILLRGQKVKSQILLDTGYKFIFKNLDKAFSQLILRNNNLK